MRGVGHHEPDQGIHPKRCVVVQPDEWSGAHVSGEKEHGWAGAGGSEALGSEALVSRGEGSRMVHGGWSRGGYTSTSTPTLGKVDDQIGDVAEGFDVAEVARPDVADPEDDRAEDHLRCCCCCCCCNWS